MADTKGLLVRGSALGMLQLAVNLAAAFFLMPFVVHSIGDRWYGMWALVGSIVSYYSWLDLGLSVATQRFIAGAIGRRDDLEVNQLINTSLATFIVFGGIALLITAGIAMATPLFIADTEEIHVFQIVVTVLGLNVTMTFFMAAFNGLITGYLRYDVMSSLELGKVIVRTGLIVYFVSSGYSLIALALITLGCDVAGNAVKLIAARRLFPALMVSMSLISVRRLPELFRYGGATLVNNIADILRFQIDHLIIAAFVNLSAVTVYNISGQLVVYLRMLMGTAMSALSPLFARYQAADDNDAVYRTYYFASKIAAAMSVLAVGAIVLFGEEFIGLWMGTEYREAYSLLVILSIPIGIMVAQSPGVHVIYGLGAVGSLARISLVEALTKVALSIALVGQLGLKGVAIGTAIPLLGLSTYQVLLANRLVKGSFGTYARHVLPVWIAGILMQLALWYIVRDMNFTSFLQLVWAGVLAYPIMILLLALAVFSGTERGVIVTAVARAAGFRGYPRSEKSNENR